MPHGAVGRGETGLDVQQETGRQDTGRTKYPVTVREVVWGLFIAMLGGWATVWVAIENSHTRVEEAHERNVERLITLETTAARNTARMKAGDDLESVVTTVAELKGNVDEIGREIDRIEREVDEMIGDGADGQKPHGARGGR